MCIRVRREKNKRRDFAHLFNRKSINFAVSKHYLQLLPNGRANWKIFSVFFCVFFVKSPQQKRRNIQKNSTHETSRNLTFGNHSGCLFRWRLVEVNFPFSAKTGNVCECVFYIVPVQPKKEERTNERTFSFNI